MSNVNSNVVLYEKKMLPPKVTMIGLGVLAIGAALAGVGFLDDSTRASYNLIVAFMWLFSIGFGALFLVALEHLVGADWSVPFRRVTEIIAGLLLFVPIISIPLFLNIDQIFIWLNPQYMSSDTHLLSKTPYLNESFFIIRNLAVFAIMILFFALLALKSFKQDNEPNPKPTRFYAKLSAVFMPVFAISLTVIGMDWLMTLDPRWFSTIFGVYYFSGSLLVALAVITYVTVVMFEKGYLSKYLNKNHFYNLGALQFAFTTFWAYIAFSQFMLIWYANIPDETAWYLDRAEGGWMMISLGLIFIRFAIPFFVLMTKSSKSNLKILKIMSIWIFLSHFYDLYWIIMPEYGKQNGVEGPMFGLSEIAVPFLVLGFVIVTVSLISKNRNLMAVNDPKFKKGLEFHL